MNKLCMHTYHFQMSIFIHNRFNSLLAFKRHVSSIQDTKIRDTPKLAKQLPEMSKGLWGWYHRKYVSPGSGAPILHIIIALGIMGYGLHYSHLSKFISQDNYHNVITI